MVGSLSHRIHSRQPRNCLSGCADTCQARFAAPGKVGCPCASHAPPLCLRSVSSLTSSNDKQAGLPPHMHEQPSKGSCSLSPCHCSAIRTQAASQPQHRVLYTFSSPPVVPGAPGVPLGPEAPGTPGAPAGPGTPLGPGACAAGTGTEGTVCSQTCPQPAGIEEVACCPEHALETVHAQSQ